MKPTAPTLRRLASAAAATCALAAGTPALAENHALIMTIDYAGTPARLPAAGIEADGKTATKIAQAMGVPKGNIRWLRNGSLSVSGIAHELQQLTANRIREGDKVFIYYSGHGTQMENIFGGGSKCTEGIVSADLQFYPDKSLESALEALAAKASQVVVMNDSCFSGGQSSKSWSRGAGDDAVAKVYYGAKSGSANDADYVCNQAVNKAPLSRSLGVVGRTPSSRILYVAASAENEVSWATNSGSAATIAWGRCLTEREADQDHNGIIDGEELRQCAQRIVDQASQRRQTITLTGATTLPLSFAAAPGSGNRLGNPNQALESLRQAADPTIPVEIVISKARLKIHQDLLHFSVRTGRQGYLYLLHIGTDGKFYQLFPNNRDSNNFVKAGTHTFPRQTWGIQAQGPAGTGYFMAYLSDGPRSFAKEMGAEGDFSVAEPTEGTVRKLGVVALGGGRFGASQVASIEEVQ